MISSKRLKDRGVKTIDKSPVKNPGARSVSAGRRRDPTPNRVTTGGTGVVRKSTSSVPRSRVGGGGTASAVNPGDFSRFVSGVRGSSERVEAGLRRSEGLKGRSSFGNGGIKGLEKCGNGVTRVSEKCGNGGIKGLEKCGNGVTRVSEKMVKKSEKIVPVSEGKNKKDTLRDITKINGETRKSTNQLNSNSIVANSKTEKDPKSTVSASIPTFTVQWSYTNTNNSDQITEIQEKKELEEAKVSDKVRIFEKKIDNSSNSLGQIANNVNNNYPSKLHEKLALLEGRVQKIASEIRKTKEILDDGNPDESKLILSEIQNKISSVEKAVGKTLISTTDKTLVSKPNHNKTLVLNCQELESRFFPHQKLMKTKTLTLNQEIDEKSIESQFLASLNPLKSNTNSESSSKSTVPVPAPVPIQTGSFNSSDIDLRADERIEELESRETKSGILDESEELKGNELVKIGNKNVISGWFVGEGDSVLLTQNDGSCLYYDIVNSEEKCEFKPPKPVPLSTFTDCWLVRATGTDGCSGRYVIAASSGRSRQNGFCTWDFYKNTPTSFLLEDSSNGAEQNWYKPCGPLLIKATSRQKTLSLYDIRDADLIMQFDNNTPVGDLVNSSPVQWRSRGKVVISGEEEVSLWDVNSVEAEPVLSIGGNNNKKKILALYVCNTDAEIGGGIRQRVSSSEAEGNDGVFVTQDSINLMDFRVPTGTGTKLSRQVSNSLPVSIFSRGDSVYVGTDKSSIEHYSLRKGKIVMSWDLEIPDLENRHLGNRDLKAGIVSQVWGSGEKVMAVCGKGMFVFEGFKEGLRERFGGDNNKDGGVLENPSFDYSGSRVLLVSKNRPAFWRYLS